MTAAERSTTRGNAKKPAKEIHRKQQSLQNKSREYYFSKGSAAYREWNRQSTIQYKIAYAEWKERQRLTKKDAEDKRSPNKRQTTTGQSRNTQTSAQSNRGINRAKQTATLGPSPVNGTRKRTETPRNMDSLTNDLCAPPGNEDAQRMADKHQVEAKSFAGQRRRKRDSLERLFIELTIPPAQYWAIVEGVVSLPDRGDRTAFLEQILLEGRPDNLPTEGRVLEMMPLEAMPGKWILDLKSTNENNDRLDDDYDLLREDWSNKRLIVRHEGHQQVQSNVPSSCEEYSKATVYPSHQRVDNMMSQGIFLDEDSNSSVVALSLIAFEGFSSAHECRLSALPVASKTLQSLRWANGCPPKMIAIPPFETEIEGAFASQSYSMSTAGGIGLLGCFVDDIAKSMTDYRIDIFCHDASNQVVGMDFCFRNCRSWNPIASPPTSSGSAPKRPKPAALTSENLQCHLKALPHEDDEFLSESPMPKESDAISGTGDKTSGESGKASDQESNEESSKLENPESEDNFALEQKEQIRQGVSDLGGIASRSVESSSERLSHEDYCENGNVNLSSTSEDSSERQNYLPIKADWSNDKKIDARTLARKASQSPGWKESGNPKRVSLEPLIERFNVCDRVTANQKAFSVRVRTKGDTLRLITPATNAKGLKSLNSKVHEPRSQAEEKESFIVSGMQSVVKPTKLDFRNQNTLIASGRAMLGENEVIGDKAIHRNGLVSKASASVTENGNLSCLSTDHDSGPSTWRDYLPSVHDVFYGVHDADDHVEATSAMLLAYQIPDPPHSTLDKWLFRFGAFFYPEHEQSEVSIVEQQFCKSGWLYFQACCHDIFFGVHDELDLIEISADEPASVGMETISSRNGPFLSWFDELWDDHTAAIDDFEFYFLNWFLAVVCLLVSFPLFHYVRDYLLTFDVPHENINVCDPGRVGYWSSFPCEYLPAYLASYFIPAQNS